MKKIFLTLIAALYMTLAYSQESENSKAVLAKFEHYYNAGQYDSIFAQFSPQAKNSLPVDKTTAFLTQLKNNYGAVTSTSFIELQSGFSVYKFTMEKGVLALSLAVDPNKQITGLYAKPYVEDSSPKMERNITKMLLPFNGEWTIFWGGDTKEQNYHVSTKFQKNAFDIIITNAENKSFKTTGKENEDYYAFGREVIAPCDVEVIQAVDGIKDNIPGILNPLFTTGNSLILKTKNNEYMLIAHFKQGSIKVKQGDIIKSGQLLGLAGNSGNSSEPHVHFQLQNIENLMNATGVKCYFDKIIVNGTGKTDYSPVKGDRVRN